MNKGENPKGKDSTSEGVSRAIVFPPKLYHSINEYRLFVQNKTGFHPSFAESIRLLVKEALKTRGAYDELEYDEEDCKDERS